MNNFLDFLKRVVSTYFKVLGARIAWVISLIGIILFLGFIQNTLKIESSGIMGIIFFCLLVFFASRKIFRWDSIHILGSILVVGLTLALFYVLTLFPSVWIDLFNTQYGYLIFIGGIVLIVVGLTFYILKKKDLLK